MRAARPEILACSALEVRVRTDKIDTAKKARHEVKNRLLHLESEAHSLRGRLNVNPPGLTLPEERWVLIMANALLATLPSLHGMATVSLVCLGAKRRARDGTPDAGPGPNIAREVSGVVGKTDAQIDAALSAAKARQAITERIRKLVPGIQKDADAQIVLHLAEAHANPAAEPPRVRAP